MQSNQNVQASAALLLNRVHTSIGCAVVESSMISRLLLAKGLCKWAVATNLCCTRCGIWALSTHWTCSNTLLFRVCLTLQNTGHMHVNAHVSNDPHCSCNVMGRWDVTTRPQNRQI